LIAYDARPQFLVTLEMSGRLTISPMNSEEVRHVQGVAQSREYNITLEVFLDRSRIRRTLWLGNEGE
jgi:hypothetical protein